MSLQDFHSGLTTQLLADTPLDNWATSNFSSSLTLINGNTEVDVIEPAERPALVIELGDAELDFQLGGERQQVDGEILCAVLWHEEDPALAFTQRLTLPSLFIQALMKDPTLGNKVDGAWVSEYQPDRNIIHPLHVFNFTVSGDYEVNKP